MYLLENLKGERWPDLSVAAQPKAFTGCSVSGDFAIFMWCTNNSDVRNVIFMAVAYEL